MASTCLTSGLVSAATSDIFGCGGIDGSRDLERRNGSGEPFPTGEPFSTGDFSLTGDLSFFSIDVSGWLDVDLFDLDDDADDEPDELDDEDDEELSLSESVSLLDELCSRFLSPIVPKNCKVIHIILL